MNHILAQAAALAAHAKVSRVDPALGGAAAYWSRHSTFTFVHAAVTGGIMAAVNDGLGA